MARRSSSSCDLRGEGMEWVEGIRVLRHKHMCAPGTKHQLQTPEPREHMALWQYGEEKDHSEGKKNTAWWGDETQFLLAWQTAEKINCLRASGKRAWAWWRDCHVPLLDTRAVKWRWGVTKDAFRKQLVSLYSLWRGKTYPQQMLCDEKKNHKINYSIYYSDNQNLWNYQTEKMDNIQLYVKSGDTKANTPIPKPILLTPTCASKKNHGFPTETCQCGCEILLFYANASEINKLSKSSFVLIFIRGIK